MNSAYVIHSWEYGNESTVCVTLMAMKDYSRRLLSVTFPQLISFFIQPLWSPLGGYWRSLTSLIIVLSKFKVQGHFLLQDSDYERMGAGEIVCVCDYAPCVWTLFW